MSEPEHKLAAPDGAISEEEEIQASAAPLLDHLTELRRRLIVVIAAITIGFVVCFAFSRQIFAVLIIPFVEAVGAVQEGRDATLYFAPLEFFFTQVRLSIFGGVILAFPAIAFEAYKFIAPGLYRREKKAALPFLIASPALFALGASLVYFVMMPFVMRFAVGFEAQGDDAPAKYELLTRVGDYLSLITTLILAFGFAFQLPVLLTLMAAAGLVTSQTLVKNRKIAVVVIFIIAAVLTPPDPFSQILLGLCILGLYEASILSVRLAERRAKAATEAAAAE